MTGGTVTVEGIAAACRKGEWTPELREAALALMHQEKRISVKMLLWDYATCEDADPEVEEDLQRRFGLIKRMT